MQMTNADRIRMMTDDGFVKLLVYGYESRIGHVPDCNENCEYFHCGCRLDCPRGRRGKNVREWLKRERD